MWEWRLSLSMFSSFLCEIRASKGVSGQLSIFLPGKGGLVVATPWDANMDAEQKLEGRVSEPAWIREDDGNNCTLSAAAAAADRLMALTASLPVHFSSG